MRKKRLIAVMMTAVLAVTAFAGCGSNETPTGTKPAVTESKTSEITESKTSETAESKTSETAETEAASEQTYDPDDNTYYHLMSDPYFDMDNAIKDEKETEHIQRNHHDGEIILYNIMDMDRYMEMTGAKVVEVNQTFAVDDVVYSEEGSSWFSLSNGGKNSEFYKHLAYYGINQYSKMEFHLMDTTMDDNGKYIGDCGTVTVLRAYTIPKDPNQDGYPVVIKEADNHGTPLGMLCEVEVDGEPGFVVLKNSFLSEYLGVDLSSVVDTEDE